MTLLPVVMNITLQTYPDGTYEPITEWEDEEIIWHVADHADTASAKLDVGYAVLEAVKKAKENGEIDEDDEEELCFEIEIKATRIPPRKRKLEVRGSDSPLRVIDLMKKSSDEQIGEAAEVDRSKSAPLCTFLFLDIAEINT